MFRSYLVWGIAASFALFQFLMQGSISVMIPDLMEDLLLDHVEISFLSSCFFYTYILFQIPAGLIIDLFGPRRMLMLAISTYIVAVLLFAFSSSFTMAIIARLLMGLMSTLAIVNAFCLAARWFSPTQFGLLVSLTEMVALCGGIIGEGVLAHLVAGVGWRYAMLTCSGVGFILLIMAMIFVQDWPEQRPSQELALSIKQRAFETARHFTQMIKIKQVWVLGLFAGLLFAILPAFGALWSVPYLMERYDITKEQSATMSSIIFLGTVLFCPLAGYLSTKSNRRHLLLIIGSIVSLIVLTIILYLPNIPIYLMAPLLFFLGSGVAVYGTVFAMVADHIPDEAKGTAMGLTNMLGIAFGAPMLQPLIGYLLRHGDYRAALSCLPATLLLALIAALFIREKRGELAYQPQEKESDPPENYQ